MRTPRPSAMPRSWQRPGSGPLNAARRCGPRWLLALALLALPALPGCLPRVDERAQAFTEDGVELFQVGRYRDARESFEAALERQPGDPNLMYNIGQCWDRQGDPGKAEGVYRQCLQRSGNHAPCRHALAVLLMRNGRRGDADQLVQEWLADNPDLPDVYVEDGWRLRQDGYLQPAMNRLQQALALDPHHVRALTELGILYEHMEETERALALYEKALARDPRQPDLIRRVNLLRSRGVSRPKPN